MIRLSKLCKLYDLDQIVYFEGKLFERLYSTNRRNSGPKSKYREILSDDDYDYVVIPALRKRLDRVFKRLDQESLKRTKPEQAWHGGDPDDQ